MLLLADVENFRELTPNAAFQLWNVVFLTETFV